MYHGLSTLDNCKIAENIENITSGEIAPMAGVCLGIRTPDMVEKGHNSDDATTIVAQDAFRHSG